MSRLEAVLHCPWVGKENLREGGSTHRIKGSVGGGGVTCLHLPEANREQL